MVRFEEFINTPSPGPDDARSETRPYTGIPDPLTVGRLAGVRSRHASAARALVAGRARGATRKRRATRSQSPV